jgi:SAM-dependent methyltransferase
MTNPTKQILNLGCGRKKIVGAVNLDVTSETEPDVVHNLDKAPWPFRDDSFDEVHAYDVIEHTKDIVVTMSEIHRVCRHGAAVNITVPHFSSFGAFTDPTHRHFFGRFTFDYFSEDHPLNFYSGARFRPRTVRLVFHPTLFNKIVWRVANRYPRFYERRLTWMLPAWFIYADLEVVKHPAASSAGVTASSAGVTAARRESEALP